MCVCVLYCQAAGVDHSAYEEQRPRRLVPDQVEEGPVHSVRQVAWLRGGGGVLVPLRRHLHDGLVQDATERRRLSRDLLQVCVCQPIRETCRETVIWILRAPVFVDF